MGIQAKILSPASNGIPIGGAGQKFEKRELAHGVTLQFLDEVMKRFVAFVKEEQ